MYPQQSSSQQAVEVSNKFRRVDDDDVDGEDGDEVEAKQRRREKSADDDRLAWRMTELFLSGGYS